MPGPLNTYTPTALKCYYTTQIITQLLTCPHSLVRQSAKFNHAATVHNTPAQNKLQQSSSSSPYTATLVLTRTLIHNPTVPSTLHTTYLNSPPAPAPLLGRSSQLFSFRSCPRSSSSSSSCLPATCAIHTRSGALHSLLPGLHQQDLRTDLSAQTAEFNSSPLSHKHSQIIRPQSKYIIHYTHGHSYLNILHLAHLVAQVHHEIQLKHRASNTHIKYFSFAATLVDLRFPIHQITIHYTKHIIGAIHTLRTPKPEQIHCSAPATSTRDPAAHFGSQLPDHLHTFTNTLAR